MKLIVLFTLLSQLNLTAQNNRIDKSGKKQFFTCSVNIPSGNNIDSLGRKQGEWTETEHLPNSEITGSGIYFNNRKTGVWVYKLQELGDTSAHSSQQLFRYVSKKEEYFDDFFMVKTFSRWNRKLTELKVARDSSYVSGKVFTGENTYLNCDCQKKKSKVMCTITDRNKKTLEHCLLENLDYVRNRYLGVR